MESWMRKGGSRDAEEGRCSLIGLHPCAGGRGCRGVRGADKEAKEALRTALDKINTQVTELTAKFTGGGTVPEVKAALLDIAPDWQAVKSRRPKK